MTRSEANGHESGSVGLANPGGADWRADLNAADEGPDAEADQDEHAARSVS